MNQILLSEINNFKFSKAFRASLCIDESLYSNDTFNFDDSTLDDQLSFVGKVVEFVDTLKNGTIVDLPGWEDCEIQHPFFLISPCGFSLTMYCNNSSGTDALGDPLDKYIVLILKFDGQSDIESIKLP